MNDILGKALWDYYSGNYSEDIITETNISEEDVLPLPYLFRSFTEMPSLEKKALQLCNGKVLDAGCGAGSHSLYLQNQGLEVVAIDLSEGAIRVAKARGVTNAQQRNLTDISEEKYDTILLLMNGTGIFGTLENTPKFLRHLKSLLAPNGQILIDSSDLQYMYDQTEEGAIIVPAHRYYGELDFKVRYKGETSDVFPWLYLHEALFEELCDKEAIKFKVVARGENFDYLARLTV
ncbi:MAG: class I SAM-dependent methyltransferase [Flavobacteriaceae bacterium]|nr:class I SAM-dependent methyltransferase [Flavobacteriaceae bacterium]